MESLWPALEVWYPASVASSTFVPLSPPLSLCLTQTHSHTQTAHTHTSVSDMHCLVGTHSIMCINRP